MSFLLLFHFVEQTVRLQIAALHANSCSHICNGTVHHTALVSSPSSDRHLVQSHEHIWSFGGVGRDTRCNASWLNQEGKLNAMKVLIIKNNKSQESSPLVTVISECKTLEDVPGAERGLYPFLELNEYSCSGVLGDLQTLAWPHCSSVVGEDHTGLLPYAALWQS